MTLNQPDPVEISTRMRPGEWTEKSLEEVITLYRAKLMEMGAVAGEIVTEVERDDDGSVSVALSWSRIPARHAAPAGGNPAGRTPAGASPAAEPA
ncbi:hypothetical protein [Arthrobacter sp. 92]|uniref:hypothetical protein n=1 Tax=Arthrobacter sp. 92 TaxID=3418175 RepID=UPI003D088FAF